MRRRPLFGMHPRGRGASASLERVDERDTMFARMARVTGTVRLLLKRAPFLARPLYRLDEWLYGRHWRELPRPRRKERR